MWARLFRYAAQDEYTRCTSTGEEDWRMTLQGSTRALIETLRNDDQADKIDADERFRENPAAAFGIVQARRHRERGLQFDMFLGVAKLVRQALIDLACEAKLGDDETKQALAVTHRFFDDFELGFGSAWVRDQEEESIVELQEANCRLSTERREADNTNQKQIEEEKRNLEAQLQQSLRMEAVGTLTGGIAHDFDNTLGIIAGNTELAMEDIPEWSPAHNNLSEIRKACMRARDIVKQILAFSRRSEHALGAIEIGPIITESLGLIRSIIPTIIDIRQNISTDYYG